MKKLKFTITLIIVLLITSVSAYFIMPLIDKINFGLDLQGGFEVLYEVSPLTKDEELTEDMLYSTYKSILKRIDILGVSEPEITIEGENQIRVKLAGITNIDDARDTISSTATLSFRDYNDNLLMTSDVLGGEAKVTKDEYGQPAISLKIKDTDTFYEVTKKVSNMDNNIIVIWLDYKESTDSYRKEKLNAENLKGGCGTSNSHCLSAATVDRAFASDVIIQGRFTKEEATTLVELINSGALPTNLKEISSRTVEASFGLNSLEKTLTAGVIGIIIVIALIVLIYRFSGLIAGFGLIIYTFLSFLVFYLIDGVLTLPGIAAMLLGIGMAVDANVICFERIKENLKIGKNLKDSFEIGNKNSFGSIIDANITTIIAAIILFIFGQSSVKGFATMLIINIIVTILIMVYLVKFILKIFVNTNVFNNKLGLFIGLNKKKITKNKEIVIPYQKLNFIKHKNKFILLSLVLLTIGCIFFFTRGANLGVDFTGGTSISINDEDITTNELVSFFKDKEYTIEKTNNNKEEINIVLKDVLEKDDITNLKNELLDTYNKESDIYVVSSVVQKALVKNAIKSLILASIGIIIYVAIRFKFNYAISGIVALIHDVLFTFLFFSVFKIEIDSVFIAAILTIIGYSINDTIVTFDIIRENYKTKYKNNITNIKDLDTLVDISIKRTLYRTILTTLTTLIPVIILLIFGSKEIMNFNIALLVGFIAGVYSSIFISNMLWLYLEKRRITKPVKNNDDDDEIQELKVKGINC
ncbi:MAG: protein translocase subunit SecD [Bacilli bacterium]|nr:protein translocase subunit SecD [Bacilli bacterium]